jgi:hypothetical protein
LAEQRAALRKEWRKGYIQGIGVNDGAIADEVEINTTEQRMVPDKVLGQGAHPLLASVIHNGKDDGRPKRGCSVTDQMVAQARTGKEELPPCLFIRSAG